MTWLTQQGLWASPHPLNPEPQLLHLQNKGSSQGSGIQWCFHSFFTKATILFISCFVQA